MNIAQLQRNSSVGTLRQWLTVLKYHQIELIRRGIDVSAALLGMLFLLPVLILIIILIKRDSPGPIFYWGSRMGKGGRPFRILKFRTMYERPESYAGPKITAKGDGRITPVGQWLRSTKLNELPQLWNVFIGDMSMVGPRPEDPAYVEKWPDETRHELLQLRPGITSPASVLYRDEEQLMQTENSEEEYLEKILPSKLRLDLLYVRNRSIASDLDIIFWTIVALIPRMKEKEIPRHLIYWGPLSRFFTRYFSWFFVDLFVVLVAVFTVGLLWRLTGPLHVGVGPSMLLAVIIALLFGIFNYILGLGRIVWSKAVLAYILALFGSTLAVTMFLLMANQFLPTPLPSVMLITVGFLAWIGFVVVRYRMRLLTAVAQYWLNLRPGATSFGERVLIIGAGEVGNFAATFLTRGELLPGFTVVGMVDDNPRMIGGQIGNSRVLGTTADIPALVEQHDIGLLVFAISNLPPIESRRIRALCDQTATRMIFLPDVVQNLQAEFMDEQTATRNTLPTDQLHILLADLDSMLAERQIQQARARIQLIQNNLNLASIEKDDSFAHEIEIE